MLERKAESPRDIAAAQPHRRGLGDQAADQLAESELGRLVLRGSITREQGLAGQEFAHSYRAYLATIGGPRAPGQRPSRPYMLCGFGYCDDKSLCLCEGRKRRYFNAVDVLCRQSHGYGALALVLRTAVLDMWCPEISLLKEGLTVLAIHYGLTSKRKWGYRNAPS